RLPQVVGGRWDTWTSQWVTPRPADLQTTEFTIQEQQIPIFFGTPADTLLMAIFAGRQAGKTHAGLDLDVVDAIRWPGRDSLVISLDYKASREPEEAFRAKLDPRWGVVEKKTDREFHFPHGHVVKFRSAENIKSARGPSTKRVHIDEGGFMPED